MKTILRGRSGFTCNYCRFTAVWHTGLHWLQECIFTKQKHRSEANVFYFLVHQLVLPCTICCATSSGSLTPRINNSEICFMPSMQASKGERHTYHPAQKKPIGHAKNHRTKNQMMAHNTFMVSYADEWTVGFTSYWKTLFKIHTDMWLYVTEARADYR